MSKNLYLKMGLLPPLVLGLSLCLLTIFSACAPKQAKIVTAPELNQSARSVLTQLSQAQSQLNSLSGFAQVKIQARGKTESFEAAILIRYPDKLRLEILDELGQSQYRLVADGRNVFWEDPGRGEFSFAPQDRDSLKKAFQLPLSVEEFVARLLLKMPPIPTQPLRVLRDTDTGEYQIELEQERVTLEFDDPRLKALSAFKTPRKKKRRYRVLYDRFESSGNYTLARVLHWEFSKPKARVEIEFISVQGNSNPPLAKFSLPGPEKGF